MRSRISINKQPTKKTLQCVAPIELAEKLANGANRRRMTVSAFMVVLLEKQLSEVEAA